ncbi:tRNA lysidine(34) synthetase TilS [Thaumasiovibrio sp. DFM-14]|uniref:tRNA lysidine(34) synthetase TilS n=1 Tax=Thaumasiovibrio sp. DFM-14 TaxID=3384792 RepID=UPI00399F4212
MLFHHVEPIITQHLPPNHQGSTLLLALSGGLDSRVMLDLLARYQQLHPDVHCRAVHIHHGLSANADAWANQCQQWCDGYGIALTVLRVTVDPSNGGVEQAARQARYSALALEMDAKTVLLTAQHRDDQCETVLLALKRGSGPKGLSAMPVVAPFAQGSHLRPLLKNVTRRELELYATEQHLSWVEDESNQDSRYERNFLRHDVVPLLTQRWPDFSAAVSRSAQLCAEQEQLLDLLLADKLEAAMDERGTLNCEPLCAQPRLMQRQLLRRWLQYHRIQMPTQRQLEQILQDVILAKSDANPAFQLTGVQLRRFKQRLELVPLVADLSAWQSPLHLEQPLSLPEGVGELLLNKEKQGSLCLRMPEDNEVITVRFAVSGLKVQPVGRTAGRRKLKKLYQEMAVPSWQRTRLPMIFYGDQLAAIAGLFVCEGFQGQALTLHWRA